MKKATIKKAGYNCTFYVTVLLVSYFSADKAKAENPEWLVVTLSKYPQTVYHINEFIYIGSNYGGYKIDKETTKIIDSTNFDSINGYFNDQQNNQWMIFGGGLIKVNGQDTVWFTKDVSKFPSTNVNEAKYDYDNNTIWIATPKGLVKMIDEKMTIYNKSNSSIQSDQIASVNLDNKSNLLIGTYFDGLILYDGNEFVNHRFDSLLEYKYPVSDANYDENSNIWFIYRDNFVKFDGKNSILYPPSDSTYNVGFIKDIYVENSQNIWIAGDNLYHFDGLKFKKFDFLDKPELNFSVFSTFKDNKDNYWFVVDNGPKPELSGIIIYRKGGIILSTEIENTLKQEGYIFPNPSEEFISLNGDTNYGAIYTIINSNGLEVGKGNYYGEISISNLVTGFYTINILDKNYKFIKK